MWKYKRGSIQYDILVILILLFIFLTPKSCFENRGITNMKKNVSIEKVHTDRPNLPEKKNEKN